MSTTVTAEQFKQLFNDEKIKAVTALDIEAKTTVFFFVLVETYAKEKFFISNGSKRPRSFSDIEDVHLFLRFSGYFERYSVVHLQYQDYQKKALEL